MKEKQIRDLNSKLEVRSENEEPIIEGYFAKFNKETELFPGAFEEIAREAFDKTLDNDIRALVDHDTRLVLGRNKSNTLLLRVDEVGLYGKIQINKKDTDAMNLYERVKRGDVSQCSFGFNILAEDTDYRDDGSVKWTIRDIDLHEVSVCTFPAYKDTGVQARKEEIKVHEERKITARKNQLRKRLEDAKNTNA